MTETPLAPALERPPEKAPAAVSKPTAPTGPTVSVRSVVYGSLAAAAVAGSAVAFAVGGWWALAGLGVAAAVAPGVGRRIVKGPPKKSNGTLAAFLKAAGGRPRSAKGSKSSGSLSWPFTGSQSRRALSKGASSRYPGATSKGKGKGVAAGRKLAGGRAGVLPAITARGRAKQAAAGATAAKTARKALPKAATARPVPKAPTTTGRPRPVAKAVAAKKPAARPAVPSRTPRSTSPGARPRLTAGAPRHGQRTGLPKVGKLTRPMSRPATAPKAAARRGVVSPLSRSNRSGTGTRGRVLPKLGQGTTGRVLPKLSGKGHPSATRRKGHLSLIPGGLGGARKLGTGKSRPIAAAKRLATGKRVPQRVARRVPNRSTRRPNPRRATVPQLIRTGLGVPRRRGFRLVRANVAARRKARRTLLRALVQRGRAIAFRLARWNWSAFRDYFRGLDARARGLTAPGPIPALPKVPATPPRTEPMRERRQPIPQLVGRRATTTTQKETRTVSNPTEAIIEAFQQLAQFQPNTALELEQFVANLANMHTEIGTAFNTLATNWQDQQPIDPAVTELVQQHAAAYIGLADMGDETHQAFETAHENELRRLREARPNEQLWDVTQNQ